MSAERWKIMCAACGADKDMYMSSFRASVKEGKRVFYCSRKCALENNYLSMQIKGTNKIWTYSCGCCGKEVTKHMHEVMNRLSEDRRFFFCSKECGYKSKDVMYYARLEPDAELKIISARDKRSKYKHTIYYQDNKEAIKKRVVDWIDNNREKHNGYTNKTKRSHRRICFEHYGLSCDCCGEDIYEFLTIDHINGGGNKHRKEIGQSVIYKWLIDNNFPEGFRTLCYNCNSCLGHYGYCAHTNKGKVQELQDRHRVDVG